MSRRQQIHLTKVMDTFFFNVLPLIVLSRMSANYVIICIYLIFFLLFVLYFFGGWANKWEANTFSGLLSSSGWHPCWWLYSTRDTAPGWFSLQGCQCVTDFRRSSIICFNTEGCSEFKRYSQLLCSCCLHIDSWNLFMSVIPGSGAKGNWSALAGGWGGVSVILEFTHFVATWVYDEADLIFFQWGFACSHMWL